MTRTVYDNYIRFRVVRSPRLRNCCNESSNIAKPTARIDDGKLSCFVTMIHTRSDVLTVRDTR